MISRSAGWRALCSFAVGMLAACATPQPPLDIAERAFADLQSEVKQAPVIPDYVSSAITNGSTLSQPSVPATERFDVSVKDVPAKAFFVGLMADAGINVVTHPDVEGEITLELKNVSVGEVLDVVRDVYGYEYRQQGGIYTIYSRKLRTEVFPIDYLDIRRVGVSDTAVSIGQISSSGGGSEGGEAGGGGSSSAANILGMAGDSNSAVSGVGITPGSRVQTLNATDFWYTLNRSISAIVGSDEGRSVIVNPQAGLVVVTAMPAELGAVRDYLNRSELSVKRQVVLEAKILEVRLNEGFDAGINWQNIQGQLQYSHNVTANSDYQIIDALHNGPKIFAAMFKVMDIRDLLTLLETQGAVQVLSSPRVSTVNNQKAVIRVGSDEFFVTGIKSNTTSSAGGTTSSPEVELSAFFSGISLDVTPQIAEDGSVILHIHPIVSDVTDQQKEIIFGDSRFSLPVAFREVRESDSVVRAQSGQVIVLGGLMQEANHRRNGKQPLLGDIPLVNTLFRTKSRGSSKTELVILLRPVVVGSDTWGNEIGQFGEFNSGLRTPSVR